MYKNQLQELAQRSCFSLPSYACIREGPDHAPRFKATVNFNGEVFESPTFCSTLRQAEHTAAEVALNVLSRKGPSKALAARILDETGVYKNLIQETAHRAGLKLPAYTTIRSGQSHAPVFSCTVELAGIIFPGEPAKTKKQAQKNAAMTAWSALKKLSKSGTTSSPSSHSSESSGNDEQEQVTRYLATLRPTEKKLVQKEQQVGHSYGPCQRGRNLEYSQFPPEVPIRRTWTQERASQQGHLLAVASVPSSPHKDQIFPFIFQPDHGQYFLAKEQAPVPLVPVIGSHLYITNHPLPVPVTSGPQVTIQEVDEKSHLTGDRDSDCWKINFLSKATPLSVVDASNSSVALNRQSDHRSMELLLEKTGTNGGREPLNMSAGGPSGFVAHLAPAGVAAPVTIRTNTVPVHSPRGKSPSPFMHAQPPRRITTSTCSSSWLKGIKNIGGMPSVNSRAPAVHIRSVVPVCSAPPANKTPYPSREGSLAFCRSKEGIKEPIHDISASLKP